MIFWTTEWGKLQPGDIVRVRAGNPAQWPEWTVEAVIDVPGLPLAVLVRENESGRRLWTDPDRSSVTSATRPARDGESPFETEEAIGRLRMLFNVTPLA